MALPKKVDSYVNDVVSDKLHYLRERWEDEKEYEDWKDYEKVLKDTLPADFSFVAVTKRPMGIKFKFEGVEYHVYIKIEGRYLKIYTRYIPKR